MAPSEFDGGEVYWAAPIGGVTPPELSTGNDNPEMFAAYLGMLGFDFTVESPPELAAAVRELGLRYLRAAGDEQRY